MTTPAALTVRCAKTKLGPIWLGATDRGLSCVQIGGDHPRFAPGEAPEAGRAAARHLDAAEKAVRAFASGDGRALERLTLDLEGTTDFQRAIYAALRKVPPGETLTYGGLAAAAGRRGAARAVGRAMATNPVPLAIPCHRVLGADGGMHGYSAGGKGRHDLGLKKRLIELESAGAMIARRT